MILFIKGPFADFVGTRQKRFRGGWEVIVHCVATWAVTMQLLCGYWVHTVDSHCAHSQRWHWASSPYTMWCAECNTHCNTHCNTVTVYVQCWKSFWKIPVLKDFWREQLPGRLCGSIGLVELMDALAAVTWDLLSTRVVEMFHLVSTGWFDIQMQGMVLTSGWGSGSWSKKISGINGSKAVESFKV